MDACHGQSSYTAVKGRPRQKCNPISKSMMISFLHSTPEERDDWVEVGILLLFFVFVFVLFLFF